MTIIQHLVRLNKWAGWFSYLAMAIALVATAFAWHFKAVCGVGCSWTHGGWVFMVCIALLAIDRAVLGMLFKCPLCKAGLDPYDRSRKRVYSSCPYCAADFRQPMPGTSVA